jgi:hypothetical protein
MKIKEIFKLYINTFKNANYFKESGMINTVDYVPLDYGFFPLGSGILTKKNSEMKYANINENCIMVLGNDFGTHNKYYIKDCIDNNNRENPRKNSTIRNLISTDKKNGLLIDADVNIENVFFTNFHVGLRNDSDNDNLPKEKKVTNIKRQVVLSDEYSKNCIKFLEMQIGLINPKIIICLGHEVRIALSKMSDAFNQWEGKSLTINELYNDENDKFVIQKENRYYVLIPHPCYLKNLMPYFSRITSKIKQLNN